MARNVAAGRPVCGTSHSRQLAHVRPGRPLDGCQIPCRAARLQPRIRPEVVERIVNALHAVNLRLDDDSLLELDVAGGYTYAEPDAPRPLYEQIDHANIALSQATHLKTKPRVLKYNEE